MTTCEHNHIDSEKADDDEQSASGQAPAAAHNLRPASGSAECQPGARPAADVWTPAEWRRSYR